MRAAHFTQSETIMPPLADGFGSGAAVLRKAFILPPFAAMRCADSKEGNDGICAIVSQLIRELARRDRRRGHRRGPVIDLYGPGNSCIDRESLALGVRLVPTVPVAYADDPVLRHRGYPFVDDQTYERYAYGVIRQLRRRRYDVVHCHDTRMIPYLERAGIEQAIATLHTCIHDLGENTPDRDICAEYPAFPIIPITQQQTDPLPSRTWLLPVNNGIATDRYVPRPRRHHDGHINIGTIGRIIGNKGFELSARVTLELQARGLPVRLNMVGGTSLGSSSYYQERIKPLEAQNPETIVNRGHLGFDDVNRFYEEADVLLLPYGCEPGSQRWYEPSGNTIMEAALKERSVVCGNKASAPELIKHGVTGVCVDLVSDRHPDVWNILINRFADGVERALASPTMGSAARLRALERYSVETMADGYESHYFEMVAQQRSLLAA